MVLLRLFGGAILDGERGPLAGRISQRRQLGLLAYLALQGLRPVSRDKLTALFWPEADADKARHSLSDAVYVIRKALGQEALIATGDDLRLNPDVVPSDVARFEAALAAGDPSAAVATCKGPLLDGFHLTAAPEFERWLQAERARLMAACQSAIEGVADERENAGDWPAAVRAWQQAVSNDPADTRVAIRFARALAAAGQPAAALRHAVDHAALLRSDFGVGPGDDLRALLLELRRSAPIAADESAVVRRVLSTPGTEAQDVAAVVPRRPVSGLLVAGLAALTVMLSAAMWRLPATDRTLDARLAVTMPFRVTGPDTGMAYLSDGMVDLLGAKLTGEDGGLRAVDPAAVFARLRTGGASPPQDVSRAEAMTIAADLGARYVVHGLVAGSPARLQIHMELVDVATREAAARATAGGTEAELTGIVDRLVAELLSRDAGEAPHRLAQLTSTSLAALRAFLAGRSAQRQGAYDQAILEYQRALDIDETFALAGVGIRSVAGWVGGSGPARARAVAVIAAHGDRLPARDRPATGPVETSAIGQLRERDQAIRRWPDHAAQWYAHGDILFHRGASFGAHQWQVVARQDFARAIELDPAYAEPVHHLASLLARTGATAELRRFVRTQLSRTPHGPIADYLRWLVWHRLRDAAGHARPALDAMPTDSILRWIGIETQDTGVGVEDGRRAAAIRLERPGTRAERFERWLGAFSHAINAGRVGDARTALDAIRDVQPVPTFHLRLAILAGLYGGAPGEQAVSDAADRLRGQPALTFLDRCVLAQWDLARRGVQPDPWTAESSSEPRRTCALVLEAQRLAGGPADAAAAAVDRLDRFLGADLTTALVDDAHVEYAHVALARLQAARGRPAQALEALGRRGFYLGWQPYLSEHLRLEAELAASLGETHRAEAAWRHFLALRNAPDPSLTHQTAQARAGLRALGRR